MVYFKGIIRAEDDVDFRLPDLGEAHLVVRDAAGQNMLEQQVKLTSSGAFTGEIKLEAARRWAVMSLL